MFKPDNFPGGEIRSYDVGHACGIFLGFGWLIFPWVETHGYNAGRAYGILGLLCRLIFRGLKSAYRNRFIFGVKHVQSTVIIDCK